MGTAAIPLREAQSPSTSLRAGPSRVGAGRTMSAHYSTRSRQVKGRRNRMRTVVIRSGLWLLPFVSAGVLAAGPDLRLLDAAKSHDVKAVSALLKQKVDVNATQPDGATAL